jgi:hypothetical protein
MFTHDAEYFRQRRRAQGIPARDPLSASRFQQRATELERLEQLPCRDMAEQWELCEARVSRTVLAQAPVRRAGIHCRADG